MGVVILAAKLQVIKKILGKTLEQEGFRYIGYKRIGYHHWFYGREDGEWLQLIAVIEHDSFKQMWVEIDEIKQNEDMRKAFSGHILNYFLEGIGCNDGQIVYKDMETFEDGLRKLKGWIVGYFLPGFKRLRRPRYRYCVTGEMEREVYQNGTDLKNKIVEKYGEKEIKEDELVSFIKIVLKKHANDSMEEFVDTFLGLSAFFGECMVNNLEKCKWEWEDFYKKCWIRRMGGIRISPMEVIFEAWQEGLSELEKCYNRMFVRQRKINKSGKLWNPEEQKDNEFYERTYMEERLTNLGVKIGFKYDSWIGMEDGWKLHRKGRMQEIWIIHKTFTEEIWVKGVTSKGKNITINSVREGLAPYDGCRFCRDNDAINFPLFADKMIRQVEKEFLPMFDNEEEYLLEYDLTPEMEKRQMMERKELLDELGKNYSLEGMAKEDMPDFVKNVLEQNAGKSMEEFGDTLLGLGIMLGEEAIRGREERHWLWDREKETCFVTAGQEVFGIDPAFALNYAWQKQKPENVDRLCEDLFGDWEANSMCSRRREEKRRKKEVKACLQ